MCTYNDLDILVKRFSASLIKITSSFLNTRAKTFRMYEQAGGRLFSKNERKIIRNKHSKLSERGKQENGRADGFLGENI